VLVLMTMRDECSLTTGQLWFSRIHKSETQIPPTAGDHPADAPSRGARGEDVVSQLST